MKTAQRITALRALLDEAGIEILIVTNLLNIRYLTGFTGSAGTLLIASGSRSAGDLGILCTDGRYQEQAAFQIAESEAQVGLEIGNGRTQFEASKLFAQGSSNIAIEEDSTSLATFNQWSEAMEQTLRPSTVKVETLRRFKDEFEVSQLRKAGQIADTALSRVLPRLKDEPTENEFAAELEFQMRMLGAEGPSFETIVASGSNSSMPHARPTDRKITEGDTVVIDFGAAFNGYHSDCTRTYFMGSTPSKEFGRIYDAVERAQKAGVSKSVLEAEISSIDRACRDSLAENQLAEFFTHSTGHGVGLEIHELPWVHGESNSRLGAGDVVTVEPGAYLPGEIGIRIEDTIAITEAGSECLTMIAKTPLIS